MNIYTIYSKSHEELFETFQTKLGELGLYTKFHRAPQLCSGDYGSEGSTDFWKLNIEYFLDICDREKNPFLYVDCDVMFIKDPTKDLEKRIKGRDLVAQLDKRICGYPMICTGIMCIRPSDKTKRMFEWMLKHIERFGNDQKAINHYLLYGRIKWTTLPKTYYSINYDNGNKVWDGGELTIKKRDYMAFHLNWTIGIKNKLYLLNQIRRKTIYDQEFYKYGIFEEQ